MNFRNTNDIRRRKIQDSLSQAPLDYWNGIDYLEVQDLSLRETEPGKRQRVLKVFLLNPLQSGTELTPDNIRLEGGQRIRDIRAVEVLVSEVSERNTSLLTVTVDQAGDFSAYKLRLTRDRYSDDPPEKFDRLLSSVEFSFKVECPNEFDCLPEESSALDPKESASIDYLTRDYSGIRRLMMDRLSGILPGWQENNPADAAVTLVELLAQAADELSYYQDAVATEAYLGTARRRVSVRRHARLLDYYMHEGCNARTLVSFEVAPDTTVPVKAGTRILTRIEGQETVLSPEEFDFLLSRKPQVFEVMEDLELSYERNALSIYTWGEDTLTLPQGATSAYLSPLFGRPDLQEGDILILEEVRSPETGKRVDADQDHRHAVRLKAAPSLITDELMDQELLEISWYQEDALPFALVAGSAGDDTDNGPIILVRANIAPADHGRTISEENLDPDAVPLEGRYRPRLRLTDISFHEEYDAKKARLKSALALLAQEPRRSEPAVNLYDKSEAWTARRDLLNSDRFASEFVLETEEDGVAYIRFGDNVLGKRPAAGSVLQASYRVGNGLAGNVGAMTLAHVSPMDSADLNGILRVDNPLAASGAQARESMEQVRLYAPQQFKSQERAVTEDDYVRITELHAEVQKAQARLRWTGSWHTVFISVDRVEGRPVDEAFQDEILAFLDSFRLTGQDLEIKPPLYVPLDMLIRVRVRSGYLQSAVKAALLSKFSNYSLADGGKGFFHPDNYSFGQSVYLSRLTSVAMDTVGVEWIEPLRFGRFGTTSTQALEEGSIKVDRLEIIRLDNDPNAPENGKIEFEMEGGL